MLDERTSGRIALRVGMTTGLSNAGFSPLRFGIYEQSHPLRADQSRKHGISTISSVDRKHRVAQCSDCDFSLIDSEQVPNRYFMLTIQ